MLKKRLLALVLAALFILSFAACGGTQNKPGGAAAGSDGVKEFTVYCFGGDPWNHQNHMDDPIGHALTAKTGVRMKAESPVGEWQEAMALIIASGDYPDLFQHTGTSYMSLYDAGALRPLRDLVMAAPNIVSLRGDEIGKLAHSYEDRDFYALGSGPRVPDVYAWEYAENGTWIQLDALRQAGYPKVESLDDFEKVVADYVAANPTVNGQPTIGMILSMQDGWRWRFSIINSICNMCGFEPQSTWYVDSETLEISAVVRRPEARELVRWFNRMYDIGLLDQESFTQSFETASAKVANGRVVGFVDCWWMYYDAIYEVSENMPEHDYLGFPVRMDPKTMDWRDMQSRGTVNGAQGYSISTAVSDADAKLLIDFFNYCASDEGQTLLSWGIEGEHYTYDKNDTSKAWVDPPEALWQNSDPRGKRRIDPEVWGMRTSGSDVADVRGRTGIGKYGDGLIGAKRFLADGTDLSDYKRDDDEYFDTRNDVQKEVFAAYGIKGSNQMFPPGYPYNMNLPLLKHGYVGNLPIGQTDATKVAIAQYEEAIPRDIAKAIVASPASFDAEWDNFLTNLDKSNMPLLEQEITEQLALRMEMWYGK